MKQVSIMLCFSMIFMLFSACRANRTINKTIVLQEGEYTGGIDIPVGSYTLTVSDQDRSYDTVMLYPSNPEEDDVFPYADVYFARNHDESVFLSICENSVLILPFECTLTSVDYTKTKTGQSIPAYVGTYECRTDLPEGQYILEFDGSCDMPVRVGVICPNDDMVNGYPSKFYKTLRAYESGKWFISLEKGERLYLSKSGASLTKTKPVNVIPNLTVELLPGKYTIGKDINPGKYVLTCKPDRYNFGPLEVTSPNSNIDGDNTVHMYIRENGETVVRFTAEKGGTISLPCQAAIEADFSSRK